MDRNEFLNDLFDDYLDAPLGSQQEIELLEEIGLLMRWTDEQFRVAVADITKEVYDAFALRYDCQDR